MIIRGKEIILQDERDSDPEDYFRWFNLEEWQYYDRPDQPFQPITWEQFEERAKKNRERVEERAKDKSKPPPGFHIDAVDGQHLGWVSIYNWDQEEQVVFIGISIPEEEHWGQGHGTEAVSLYINYLFDNYDLDTIRTATWTGNKRMVRCAQKAGFRNEKITAHSSPISVRGEPLERIELSLPRADWLKNLDDG
jgi:RimJ/RimL family protein N-acetyltransferase